MVYAGTEAIAQIENGRFPMVELTVAGLDADAEESSSYDLSETKINFVPKAFSLIVDSTTTTTVTTIDVNLQGSLDESNWVELINVVAKDTYAHWPKRNFAAGTAEEVLLGYRHIKVVCDDVGTGNVHTARVYAYK